MILCGFCFLFRAFSLTHPGFPFPCPIFAAFFLTATTSVLCGFLASMEPKGQGGRLANGTELTSNITQRLSWKTSDSSALISSVDSFFSPWLYSISFVQSKEISSIPQSLNATSKIQCVSAVCPAPFHRQPFQCRQRSRGGNLLQKGIGIKTRNAG